MRLLRTKFHIPGAPDSPGILQRPRLIRLLSSKGNGRFVIVQAPAGFGKTTLLSQWACEQPDDSLTCWVSIDPSDNQPLRFWQYIFESVHGHISGHTERFAALLHHLENKPLNEALIYFINEIDSLNTPVSLILDDYHLIENPRIHDSLGFFLDHPLKNATLLISTRRRPPLELSRLRISGRLTEILAKDLKFTTDEIRGLMQKNGMRDLEQNESLKLHRHTEGWAAALKLTLLNHSIDNPQALPEHPQPELMNEYLFEEVFRKLPEDLRSFLVTISLPDRFCVSLCEHLSDGTDTRHHIDYLKKHGLFLILLDHEARWFRFHHLFLDFLRSVLQNGPPDKIQTLHFRAAEWFHQNRYIDEAFQHALAAENPIFAGQILSDHISHLYGHGGEQAVIPYFERLGENIIFSSPLLLGYYLGFKIFSGNFTALDEMKKFLNKDWNKKDRKLLEGFYLAFQSYEVFYVKGDLEKTITVSEKALALLPEDHASISHMLKYMQTISFRYCGKIEEAIELTRDHDSDDLLISAMCATNRSDLELELGCPAFARKVVQDQISRVETVFGKDNPPALYGFLYVSLGKILREENRLNEARQLFEKGLHILNDTKLIELIVVSLGEYSVLLTSLGQFDAAHHIVDKATNLARLNRSWVELILIAQKNSIWIKEKKLDLVSPWAGQFPVHPDMTIPFIDTLHYLVLVRYYIAIAQFNNALVILDKLMEKDRKDKRNGRLVECYVLKAKTFYLNKNKAAAEKQMKHAFELVRNERFIRVFSDEAAGIEPLYHECLQQDLMPEHLAETIRNLLNQNPAENGNAKVTINTFIEEFNDRELDLLKLFKQGLSNKEAAGRMCLSVNTVRWYASRIFAKLDVKRRGQAVSKATELQLI